jgi:uncharacterized radical SAM superfamily Fe-S cluster-containing enzyme
MAGKSIDPLAATGQHGAVDCTPCVTPGPRADRPHTFFAHEPSTCPACGTAALARVVLRDDGVAHLVRCPACGPQERLISNDARAFVTAFLAKGVVPPDATGDHLFKLTTSTCPGCLALLEAKVVIRDRRVYFLKDCPACGPSEALVSEDADYYVRAYAFARAGTEPLVFRTEAQHGCPTDCGTCNDHEQHTCLPIIEITDHCNLECPVCIVNNQYSTHLEPATFARMIEGLVAAEGTCESVALSGGEPTSHPQILELIGIASRPEIARVVLITNGLRIARDRDFAQSIKDSGAYVALQLDGFDARSHELVRGRDLCAEKTAALAILEELDIPTQLIFVAVRGVNEDQIGRAVELLLTKDFILSLNFQPVAYTGLGGGKFAHDPMDRLTIPGVIRRIEEQTAGKLAFQDFSPLPCSHPQCVSLTYLLKLNDGTAVPFARFVDLQRHASLLRSSATLPASPEIEEALGDVIHHVWARKEQIPQGEEILAALRRTLDEMFPPRPLSPRAALLASERRSKSIFLHHYMDRHDFDLERLRKCCHHYPQVDGRIMPACGFNMFHRGAARGPQTPLPEPPHRASLRLPVVR